MGPKRKSRGSNAESWPGVDDPKSDGRITHEVGCMWRPRSAPSSKAIKATIISPSPKGMAAKSTESTAAVKLFHRLRY